MNRRSFLKSAACTSVALSSSLYAQNSPSRPPVAIFTKPFQSLSFSDFADVIADIGVDGVELPVRPRGHIEPEAAAEKLPEMATALAKNKRKILILASGINSVDSPHAEKTLKAARAAGIKQYRMSYYKYDLKSAIEPQLADFKAKLKDLAAMNREIGIQAIYQNHSGRNYFGAPLWDLQQALKEIDSQDIASAFDIGHATVEGGKSWPLQWQLLKSKVASVYVKDPIWRGKSAGWAPLGEGLVKKDFFRQLNKNAFGGTLSLHVEYLSHKDHSLQSKFIEAFKKDFSTLKSWVG